MPGNNSLEIMMTQKEDGAVLSVLTLSYPSLENATANVLSQDLVDALQVVTEKWAESKATLVGEAELFELANGMRKGQRKESGEVPKAGR